MAHAPGPAAHTTNAERAFGEPDFNLPAFPAGLDCARRYRFQGDAQIVQSSGRRKSGGVSGVEHAFSKPQSLTRICQREALEKILRCDAGPAGEQPVKAVTTQARARGKFCQVRLRQVIFIHVTDDAGYAFVIVHALILPEPLALLHPVLAALLGRRAG